MGQKYICYVTTYYPSFEVVAESQDEAWFEALSQVWDKKNAETEITCELIPEGEKK